MLWKGGLEQVDQPGPGFYSRLFLVQKATGGWRPIIDLSTLDGFVTITRFQMETVPLVLGSVWMFSVDFKDAYFQIPIHPDSQLYPVCCRKSGVSSLGSLFWPVVGFSGLHQSLLPCIGVGSSTGDPPALVSGLLVSCGGVSSLSSPSSRSPAPVMPGTGDCSHLGEIRPGAFQSSPVILGHGDRHLSGEGLNVRLSNESFSGSCLQFPSASILSSKDMAAAVGPPCIAGTVCSLGSVCYVPASVASEGFLAADVRQSLSAGSSVSGRRGVCSLVAAGGEV